MGSMAVVVIDELFEYPLEVAASQDEYPIEAFAADAADEPLGEGVGARSTDWSADDPDALGTEDLVEAGCELGVPVPDEEPDRPGPLGELNGQVSRLLDHPGP